MNTSDKSDRELLELAAKAAGLDAYWDDEYECMQMDYSHKGGTNREEWNPLTDDGDALRLLVKVGGIVGSFDHLGNSSCSIPVAAEKGGGEVYEMVYHQAFAMDQMSATRRAVVLAAAALAEAA